MITQPHITYQLTKLNNAITSLNNWFEEFSGSLLQRDGLIQRFEYTIEITRKTLKLVLEYYSLDHEQTPKSIIRSSFETWIIKDSVILVDMIDCRNKLSHEYNEQKVEELFEYIQKHYHQFDISLEEITSYLSKHQ